MSSSGDDPISSFVGGVVRAADEGIGELSGRNYQRQQSNEESDLEDARREAEAAIAQEKLRAQRLDVAASKTAQALQNTARSQQQAADSPLLGEQDFLGL